MRALKESGVVPFSSFINSKYLPYYIRTVQQNEEQQYQKTGYMWKICPGVDSHILHCILCNRFGQQIWETENLLQNPKGERYQLSETKSCLILFFRSFPKRSFGGEYYAWCQEGRTEYARSMQGRGKMWVLWHVCLARLLRIPAGASQEEGRSSRLLHLPEYNGTVCTQGAYADCIVCGN